MNVGNIYFDINAYSENQCYLLDITPAYCVTHYSWHLSGASLGRNREKKVERRGEIPPEALFHEKSMLLAS